MTLTFNISSIYKEYVKNSNSSSIITLTIKYNFYGTVDHSQEVTLTLEKSKGYKIKDYTIINKRYIQFRVFNAYITEVNGYLYISSLS